MQQQLGLGLIVEILHPPARGLGWGRDRGQQAQREYLADEGGAKMCGHPLALANALRKLDSGSRMLPMQEARPATAHLFIVNPLTAGGLLQLFSTHPPMEDRIARLEQMAR